MSKVYILIEQIYEEVDIVGVFASEDGANNCLEEIRIKRERDFPGCWALGGWEEDYDWANGGKRIKVRQGPQNAFKNFYCIKKYDLEP